MEDVHKQRILRLADVIETKEFGREAGTFNMSNWLHDPPTTVDEKGTWCGTPSCIAGWAYALANGDDGKGCTVLKDFDMGDASRWLLGEAFMEGSNSSHLFVPAGLKLWKISPSEAATTLRILAETGEVNWWHVRPEVRDDYEEPEDDGGYYDVPGYDPQYT